MRGLLFACLLFPFFCFSQINESDSLKLKANLSLSGFWQGGNVETIIFRAKSEISVKPFEKWAFKTTNSYVYQEFGNEKADEDILSLNFLYFNPDKKIHPFALGFFSTNFRREIDIRSLLGAGVSFEIFEKKKNWLKLSLSSEYEQTRFDSFIFNFSEYNGNESINTFRATAWISGKWYLFKEKVIIKHESYFQPSLEDSNNYRWQGDISLELPVWKHLNFKINYLHTYESIVIQNQSQEDKFLTFGFTLKSY
ncbi:MAG: DUF481 domain-containing protein [Bacteroidota bacterium]